MGLIANFKNLADDKRYIQDLREIVMNDTFLNPTDSMFNIVPGIMGGQQVAAMKDFEYVTKLSAGCGGNGISPTFPAFSQFWNPKLQEVKVSWCFTEFETSFVQWGFANGYDRKDLGQTELGVFLEGMITRAMTLDLQRIVLLADKDIAALDVLTDEATYTQFYNTIDKGLISTLVYLKTLPEFAGMFQPLTKNTGAMTDQLNLPATYAVELYESITDNVYDFDGDIFLTSNRLFKNYAKWLKRGNGYSIESNIQRTQDGVTDPRVDGQNLAPVVNYDRWRKKDFITGDPATIYLPHFAMFTRKEWLQVGVDDLRSLTDIRMEYVGGADERFWFKANYMLDFKMVNPYGMMAAI
jgi:hypothetical protein